MNQYIIKIFFICMLALNIAASLWAKRMPPTTPPAELTHLKELFIKAVQNKNWLEVNQLLDHIDAWAYANVPITPSSSLETALEFALYYGELAIVKKLIKTSGAYCGVKSETIAGLEKDITRLKQDLSSTQDKSQGEQLIRDATEIIQLLKSANSRCY